jgi:predicted dehydrogenase
MSTTTRRSFLGAAAAAGTLAFVRPVHSQPSANDKPLKMGIIGVGWYGMVDAKAALKVGGVEVTAVCDVDSEHLDQSVAELDKLQGKKPQTFKLYTEMLDQADLDVVVIATPPHWHACS